MPTMGHIIVRLAVYDRPGAMAAIAKCMGDEGVSLESIVQRQSSKQTSSGEQAPVIMITHEND